jgi:hypothetical protein
LDGQIRQHFNGEIIEVLLEGRDERRKGGRMEEEGRRVGRGKKRGRKEGRKGEREGERERKE